jgi:hypothetical protein
MVDLVLRGAMMKIALVWLRRSTLNFCSCFLYAVWP